jgi:hypothetical protein
MSDFFSSLLIFTIIKTILSTFFFTVSNFYKNLVKWALTEIESSVAGTTTLGREWNCCLWACFLEEYNWKTNSQQINRTLWYFPFLILSINTPWISLHMYVIVHYNSDKSVSEWLLFNGTWHFYSYNMTKTS